MATLKQGYRPEPAGKRSAVSSKRGSTRSPSVQAARSHGKKRARAGSKKKSGFTPVKIILSLACVAVLVVLGVMTYLVTDEVNSVLAENTFYPGVYVDGVPLNGLQPAEAVEYLYNRLSVGFRDWSLQLVYGEDTWTIDSGTIGLTDSLRQNVATEVNNAFLVGRSDESFFDKCLTVFSLKEEPYEGFTGDIQNQMERIDPILGEIAGRVYVQARDASWTFDANQVNPIRITSDLYGSELDIEALKSQVFSMVSRMESGVIQITPVSIRPNVTTTDIEKSIVRLASFTTQIERHSTEDRIKNIVRGCEAFHGKSAKPGERVSFNSWVGKRTKKNGFYDALEIASGGAYEMGVGGGICQVSSTLYNAVVQAGLHVESRTNHGRKVGYLDMGLDATVLDDRIDFVFRNTTESEIYFVARVEGSGKNRTCVFQIYGRPDPNGYTYSLKAGRPVEDKPIPEPTHIPDREGTYVKYAGRQHKIDGLPGYTVKRSLITKDAGGNIVSEEELSTDVYNPVAPVVYEGVTQR